VHPNLGAVATAPFYAMRPTLVGTGIPTVGLDTEPSGQVIGADGVPVPGLYAAGNSSALLETGAGYQSGVANTRSLIVAYTSVADAQKAG
jgi:3-oxosteroid 1-dehydrogenase